MSNMTHTTNEWKTPDGTQIFEQAWVPDTYRASVLIVHGLAEHSGRYAWVAEQLNTAGYAVYTFDLRGHGQSDGQRCYVDNFDLYASDLVQMIGRVKEAEPDKPLFIYGHSMGGAISTFTMLRQPAGIDGLVLTGPALKEGADISPMLIRISSVLSKLIPKRGVMQLDGSSVSRDPAQVELYNNDPLNFRGAVPARTGAEMLRAIRAIDEGMETIGLPLLIMHGTEDRLTNVEGSMQLNARAKSADKTLKLYEGFYHELTNEPEEDRKQVMADMIAWLDARV